MLKLPLPAPDAIEVEEGDWKSGDYSNLYTKNVSSSFVIVTHSIEEHIGFLGRFKNPARDDNNKFEVMLETIAEEIRDPSLLDGWIGGIREDSKAEVEFVMAELGEIGVSGLITVDFLNVNEYLKVLELRSWEGILHYMTDRAVD